MSLPIQNNSFRVDVVYSLPTDLTKVKSTTGKGTHVSASIENIIADKMHASYRYRGGKILMICGEFQDRIKKLIRQK